MNKGVEKKTGYKGLADISTSQGFEPHPRFGHGTRIHLRKWGGEGFVIKPSNHSL